MGLKKIFASFSITLFLCFFVLGLVCPQNANLDTLSLKFLQNEVDHQFEDI
jgi:hypothetical protein